MPNPTAQDLHVFREEGGEYYVARDLAHALELWQKQTGGPWQGEYGDDDKPEDYWEQLPDERTIRIMCDTEGNISDSGESVRRTCREWCDREGEGLLCAEDY